MKYAYFFIAVAVLSSCNLKRKSDVILTDKEAEYLKTRDAYIEQFKPLQKAGMSDSLFKMDNKALVDLQARLYDILKDSKFSSQGNINLETLLGFLGFGMADGLSFEKDSMTIFYTSKNLFYDFYKGKINSLDKQSPDDLSEIFLWTVLRDAYTTNFFSKKIASLKNIDEYVMIGQVGNARAPSPPDHLFALVSAGKYVYIIKKQLKEPIKELPQCKAIGDSLGKMEFDTLFEHYRKCYLRNLPNDPQFEALQKQLEGMVKYIEP